MADLVRELFFSPGNTQMILCKENLLVLKNSLKVLRSTQ